jgi:hypothetical protein
LAKAGESPGLGDSDGARSLAEHGGCLVRRQPGDDAEFEQLTVAGGQLAEGGAHGGVLVGELDGVGGK